MHGDEDPKPSTDIDPATLKDALGRTGRMLKNAGLPFEEEEFDEDETSDSSSDESSSSSGDDE